MFAMTGISVLPLNCTSNTAASDSVTGLGSTNARLSPVQNHSHKNSKLLYKGMSHKVKYILTIVVSNDYSGSVKICTSCVTDQK